MIIGMWRMVWLVLVVGLLLVASLSVKVTSNGLSACFIEANGRVVELKSARLEGVNSFCTASKNDFELLDSCIKKQEKNNYLTTIILKVIVSNNNILSQNRLKHNQLCREYPIQDKFPGLN